MLSVIQRSDETVALYSRETVRLIAQFQSENPDANPHILPIVATAEWFLNSHGRWAPSSIRVFALALEQEIKDLLEYDTFDPDSPMGQLLWRLKKDRPDSTKKVEKTQKEKAAAHQKKVAAKKKKSAAKKRKKRRKSLPMQELRKLVAYFRSRPDEFARWIAGYIMIASRLGWRPGEIINLQRDGNLICSAAEKHTNGRGLTDRCEVDISAYFEKARLIKRASLASEIDRWIADAQKWKAYYGTKLQSVINGRLATASKSTEIARVCTYTFRHFAISCMKASKFTCAEIAVIINHASDRTAGEHYGKRHHGVKRPQKMLQFDRRRLPLVRNLVRAFDRPAVSEKQLVKENRLVCEVQKAAVVENETVPQFSL
jgi:integrase